MDSMPDHYVKKERGGVTFFSFPLLEREKWLIHGISTRRFSGEGESRDFTLGYSPHLDEAVVAANREVFLRALPAEGCAVLPCRQIHSDRVSMIDEKNAYSPDILCRDGSVTHVRRILLPVVTADCAAVFFADPGKKAIGAVHVGWRGLLKGIVSRAVDLFRHAYKSDVPGMLAAIGPCLGPCCFEVGWDVAEKFSRVFPLVPEAIIAGTGEKPVLNLPVLISSELQRSGFRHDRITSLSLCTRCHSELFYSYRREGKQAGRMLGVIGIQ